MTTRSCGCSPCVCGCCEGTQSLTPLDTANRPGLDALVYRIGTHGSFFETMKARLSSMTVTAPGPDGQTIQTFQPLQGLTTRASSDPAIALLDGWASAADVLTFYQERIANEGYLRTAIERRSVLELARLVGYSLRPGVAATVYLAYTLDDNQTTPVTIPLGARSQSIPGPDELPQSFETSDPLLAHTEWNNLEVRRTNPQNITFDNVLSIASVYLDGTSSNLKIGDLLLFVFGQDGEDSAVRKVVSVEAQFDRQRTTVNLELLDPGLIAAATALQKFLKAVAGKVLTLQEQVSVDRARRFHRQIYLGIPGNPIDFARVLGDHGLVPGVQPFLDELIVALGGTVPPPAPAPAAVTTPARFITSLLTPPHPQAASALQLPRSLAATFHPNADVQPQLLVAFLPELRESFYTAWESAVVSDKTPELIGVFAFRVRAPLFGSTANRIAHYTSGQLDPFNTWPEWDLNTSADNPNSISLDQAYEAILPGSFVMIQQSAFSREVKPVKDAVTTQRSDYGINGPSTSLSFDTPWRDPFPASPKLSELRPVLVYGQAEALKLTDQPVSGDVAGREIPLQRLYSELTSGRWVILSGERADIPGVAGVQGTELLMIAGLKQDFDATVPGDKTRTTLQFATDMAFAYKRDKLTIYGNVVKATHGETKLETLGAGDATQAFQTFTLKQPPVTYVPAPNPSGVDSTLKIYVNDVEWHETGTLAGLTPKDREFITTTSDAGQTSVIFGNGEQGARLPTGIENIKSVYRSGIGQPGNVKAGQISMLQTRPLGVKSVLNPLRASGGAGSESRDQGRENAPLAVLALDRLVSLQDYADFTRTFAGIGKAASRRLTSGRRQLIHVTIAGADDIPIDKTSDLYRNLAIALRKFGDADVALQVDPRELVALVLSAKVRLDPDYLWDPVAARIRALLLDTFGFHKRSLGQPALLCEIIAAIQAVDGVVYVEVDAFGGIPQTTQKSEKGVISVSLITIDEITALIQSITSAASSKSLGSSSGVPQRVDANLARSGPGGIRAAQLAIFTPDVPDTIILDRIL